MPEIRLPELFDGLVTTTLASDGTTLTSPQLASLPVVSDPDTLPLTLAYGTQRDEIITITALTAGATTATISRGAGAQQWPVGTVWSHTPSASDFAQPPSWLYHAAGIPDDSVGNNGDWAQGQDGTIYEKAAGTWAAYGGGGGLPSWFQSGAGAPVGVVTPAQKGALYQDTTNGALYEALDVTSADWVQVGGTTYNTNPVGFSSDGVIAQLMGSGLNAGGVIITDALAAAGSGAGVVWHTDGVDGHQYLDVFTGLGEWRFKPDGGLQLPNGNSLYNTTAAPDNAVGSNGDWSLGADGHLYRKASGTWAIAQQAATVNDLTDSTGGTPDTTLVDVTTTGVADPAKVNADFASLNAQVKAISDALKAAGLMA